MGLLDDAIREHLEFKRLRGADPGAVAREEQDALGPARREDAAEHDEQEGSDTESPLSAGSEFAVALTTNHSSTSHTGQETVEINMNAVLNSQADAGDELRTTSDERAAPATHPAHSSEEVEEGVEEEPLERVASEDRSGELVDGEEPTAVGDARGDDNHSTDNAENALTESPGSSRDAPEQGRLWPWRRNPRGGDFDE